MEALDHLALTDPALPARMQQLLDAPARLLLPERLLVYALVRGLRPARCLEIGTNHGGSSAIICAALDDVGAGRLVCVDPAPLVPDTLWAGIAHRATLIAGPSPEVLPEAVARAGGLFDFVFVDGDHTRAGVERDIEALLGVTAPGAYLLCHDAHYLPILEAMEACVARHPGRLIDAGTLSTLTTAPVPRRDGTMALWGGFRLLRVVTPSLT